MKRAVVIGAGISGLAAALLLRRRGWEVEVREAAERAGGLLKPFHFRGRHYDLGSHRLHPNALSEPLLRELAPAIGLGRRIRRGTIVLNRRHIAYPLSAKGLLTGLGLRTSLDFAWGMVGRLGALRSWENDRVTTARDRDVGFDAFVRNRVGRAAYEAFYKPYAEKVWGIDPRDLSQSVAKKRVSMSSPFKAVVAQFSPNRHKERYFLYPQRGMVGLIDAFVDAARRSGVTLQFGRSFDGACDEVDADVIVHSGHALRRVDAGLEHRGLYLVFMAWPLERLGRTDTFYTPSKQTWFGRFSEAKNFLPHEGEPSARRDETVTCLEIPEGRWGDGMDFTKRSDELLEQLREARIVPPGIRPLSLGQLFLPRVYPLYRRGWLANYYDGLGEMARDARLLPIGRQGLFLHCNIDHCIRISSAAAEHLAAGGTTRAWVEGIDRWTALQVRD